jgi:hypothetical protein
VNYEGLDNRLAVIQSMPGLVTKGYIDNNNSVYRGTLACNG